MKIIRFTPWFYHAAWLVPIFLLGFLLRTWLPTASPQTGRALTQEVTPTPQIESFDAVDSSIVAKTASPEPLTEGLRATEDPALLNLPPTPLPLAKDPTPTPYFPPPPRPTSRLPKNVSTAEPTQIVPWPTDTPLPMIDESKASRFSSQNIEFGALEPLNGFQGVTEISSAKWSPDGQWVAFSQATGDSKDNNVKLPDGTMVNGFWLVSEIIIAGIDGANRTRVDIGYAPTWSPTGDYLAYISPNEDMSGQDFKIMSFKDNQITLVTTIKSGFPFSEPAWLSNTELLYYDEVIMIFDLTTGEKQKFFDLVTSKLPDDLSTLKILIANPSHQLVGLGGGQFTLVLERVDGKFQLLKQLEGLYYNDFSFSPDGTLLAYVSSIGQLNLITLRDETPPIKFPWPSRNAPTPISWAADSASLFYKNFDGLYLVNRDGSGLKQVAGITPEVNFVMWSPQADSLLLSDWEGHIFRLGLMVK